MDEIRAEIDLFVSEENTFFIYYYQKYQITVLYLIYTTIYIHIHIYTIAKHNMPGK